MKTDFITKSVSGTVVALAAVVLAGTIDTTPVACRPKTNGSSDEDQLVHIGYAIAPVPLNLEGKNSGPAPLAGTWQLHCQRSG